MTWSVALEVLVIGACGVAAWWVYRAAAKRMGGTVYDGPMTVAGAIRRLMVSAVFPLVWASLATGVFFLLPLVIQPSGVLGAAVPVLWFFMIYPLASILIVQLMPRRSTMR
ncbi:MAG TPA: hypothetical protein VEI24_04835, partial [Nitrospiria bacterium]|nr:hypothetical protein [Nitrospiria bacterium]